MLASFCLHRETHQLALLRVGPDQQTQIELRSLNGQLLGEIGPEFLPQGSRWSPDGTTLAFYSNDGRIYLYRLGARAPELVVADPALDAGFCQWSADGHQLVYSAHGRTDPGPPRIYTIDVVTRQSRSLTQDSRAVDRFPQWAPSGEWVAFQRQHLDEPDLPMHVYVVNVGSGVCFQVSGASNAVSHVGWQCWSLDSSALLITERLPSTSCVSVVRLHDGVVLWRYEAETLQGGVFSPQGDRVMCLCTDELRWFSFPDGDVLERLPLSSFSSVRFSLTGANLEFDAEGRAVYFLGVDTSLYRWEIGDECRRILAASPPPARPEHTHEAYAIASWDGRTIPVQRFIPHRARSAAILYVHGGPHEAIDPEDPFMLRLLADGVEVICAAYRGTAGYGPEHVEANRGEYGRADVWDVIAAGRDWKQRVGQDRPLVPAGASYGGFLSLLALAQKDPPWAGGIVMWPVSGMHRLGLHVHRALPTDPDQHALALIERSPLAQARNMRGPVLILHGTRDTSATTAELTSIRDDIVSEGGECDLIVFPDGDHGLHRHRDALHAAVMQFLGRFT